MIHLTAECQKSFLLLPNGMMECPNGRVTPAQAGDSALRLWGEPGSAHLAVPGSADWMRFHTGPNSPRVVLSILGTMRSNLLRAGCSYRSHRALAGLTPPILPCMENLAQNWASRPPHSQSRGRIKAVLEWLAVARDRRAAPNAASNLFNFKHKYP